ncbi:secreted protein [Melampsora americana]|nr:secreted protein [Melampsora americana]
MFSHLKIAVIMITLFGMIYAKTPTPHYQSQCCPRDGSACYSQPSYCSNSKSCRKVLADYYCNEAGGYCHSRPHTEKVSKWYQCGYKKCDGEFKCVTLVFADAKTESLDGGEKETTPRLIPSSIEKGE